MPPVTRTPDAACAALRGALLGGRGPGGSPAEIAQHTRDRSRMAGRAVVDLLEQTQDASTAARKGPSANRRARTLAAAGLLLVVVIVEAMRRRRR